ncbi:MAG: 23S rRNA (uracil(1939)-C(5))-methyltransferase RlmD [Bacteroidetes bacterium 4572_77]|nr:MAG: 23S rRNA (uracil(1939)-C(5))-methyltransferase RlmD [Bacteroidetes bacterium 4572_77]
MGRRRRRQQDLPVLENIEMLSIAAEGKSFAKVDEKALFVPFTVPGDIVDVKVTKNRAAYMEANVQSFKKYSPMRIDPKCEHFGTCGGCKWQMISYQEQLKAKQQQVQDNFQRLGDFEFPEINPILASEKIYHYRNKLEFTFSSRIWLTEYSKEIDFADRNMNGLGFHMPGMFDRILDIENCYLQDEPSNQIRLSVRDYALKHGISFFHQRAQTGFLRNLIIRTSSTGDIMVILVVGEEEESTLNGLLGHIAQEFPQITSLMYVLNQKKNTIITDLPIKLYKGNPFLMEEMEGVKFKVGPVSFYQTNSDQAYEMYKIAREYAQLSGKELVYDLYTGTGTIANFIAKHAKKVVGVEYVPEAIEDAQENAQLNNIENTVFYAGDLAKVLNEDFVKENGRPDVVITDPPRAGMHEKVIQQLVKAAPKRIVYISCNPATQARDISLMKDHYKVEKVQPLDMFPQTHHLENICLLVRIED